MQAVLSVAGKLDSYSCATRGMLQGPMAYEGADGATKQCKQC